MLRFLLVPAVLAVVAYATLGGADFSDIMKFGCVLLVALCAAVIYAWAARAKRRTDNAARAHRFAHALQQAAENPRKLLQRTR